MDMADLKRKSVRGGMFTMASQGVSIVVQLASTVILARILSPKDYGTISMVLAITTFAGMFRDLGLSAAAIQKKDLTDTQQSNLFWLNVAMGAALTAIVATASPLVAWFYGKPELNTVTIALSFSFLIASFGAQHTARLTRDMQFARKAAATISGSLVTLAVAVACALNGLAYWSLVWGNLTGAAVTSLLFFLLSPFWPGWYKKGAGIRSMLGFGANVTGFSVVNYFHRNLDNILIGRFWGTEALGLYSKAYSLLMLPVTSIHRPISAVAYPALCRLQNHQEAFRSYYQKITRILALLSMPMCAVLFLSAEPMIHVVLGAQWIETSTLFQLLAIVAFIQPSSALRGVVVMSLGKSGRYLRIGLVQAILTSAGFLVGVMWGPKGVAISYIISSYVSQPLMFHIAFKDTFLSINDYWLAIKPILLSATVATIGCYPVSTMSQNYADHNLIKCIVIGVCFLSIFLAILASQKDGIATIKETFYMISPKKKQPYVEPI